ncbi:hypothetical protein TRAPUB_8487 [Trametes pubescens]|uniref:Uncharacterized protein n=1 Tax=Trametes pubescens TaxID=154538 RepID=A0A1M2W528_TRAPU|nr:hypothetical protein TRAPUB_8487 [Trametes pubescens]
MSTPSTESPPLAFGNTAETRTAPVASDEEHRVPSGDGVSQRRTKVPAVSTAIIAGASHIINWLYDVIRMVATLSKGPVALVLLFYISSFLFQGVIDTTFSGFSALSPICNVFPRFPLCTMQPGAASVAGVGGTSAKRVDFPSLMDLQSRTLDRLLSQSATGSQLALSVKQAELAVKDLSTLVRASNLTSKEQLASSLDEFTVEAKATGRGLQKLSAKLYGAVDNIIAFDEYAFRALASTQAAATLLHTSSHNEQIRQTLGRTFESSLNVLSSEVARVILETTYFTGRMDALEERLATIHALCERENFVTAAAWDSLLSELWSMLGGNCDKKSSLNQQLFVLENVGRYRSLAVAHVAATSEALAMIEADLSELREKLAAPGLVDDIPIEVHLASIERSARRLKEEKLKVDASWDTGSHPYDRAALIGIDTDTVSGVGKGRMLYG